VLLVALDYGKKVVDVTRVLHLTGDETADMAAIAQAYDGVRALYPKNAAPIRFADPATEGKAADGGR
jgi:hypothetical protein